MTMRSLPITVALVFLLVGAAPAAAAEIRVLTSGAYKAVILALAPAFERTSGHAVIIQNDTAGGVARRIEGGEVVDLAVLTPAGAKDLTAKGKLAPGSSLDLARVFIGVAVKEGAPKPDIASVEAFKQALLDAPSVTYIDPAAGGSSGIYLDGLLTRLGIADQVRPKALLMSGGYVAERLVSGEAALAIHQISELKAVNGVTVVGPLPAAIGNATTYTGAVAAASPQRDPAQALLAFLAGDAAIPVLKEKGMEAPR
jgi:molybdate transport system substrate-binding protein